MNLSLPQQIARLDSARLRAYRENLDFYQGHQWLGSSRRRERRLTFNYSKVFLEKVTSYLVGGLAVTVEPLEDAPQARARARAAEHALRLVAEANSLEELDFDCELDASILGDGCYKVTWDEAQGRVRITAPDVQGLFAWWQGDDFTRLWRVASRYRLTLAEAQALYGFAPKNNLGSRSKDEVPVLEVWTERDFQLWLGETLWEERPNPYRFIPFIIYPNLREPKQFWGISDLTPLMEPARELNRAYSQLSTILELSGNPIAVLENIEDARDIAVQPGAVWELPEKARAYLLDLLQGGGVQLHVSYIDLLYRALHDLAETPRTAFGDNRQALSGVALEMELNPLIQKVQRKRLIRSTVYRQRAQMVLRLISQRTGVDFSPLRLRVLWGPVLPPDRSRQIADQRALVAAGILSRRRAAADLGVEEPEAEFARWLEERRREAAPGEPAPP